MTLGLVFIGIGLVWLQFRKWIARRQHWITSRMLGRKADDELTGPEFHLDAGSEKEEQRIRGFERCWGGMRPGLFCLVLNLCTNP